MKKIVCVLIIAAALIGGCAWYVNDYYALDEAAVFTAEGSAFETYEQGGWHVYAPENPRAGLVFYPGGKVDAPAYGPLMEACAARDILCVLVEMPLRLAILDADAGAEVPETFPQVEKWYIGGHSLGGSMAASCLAGHPGMFEGLVLLAAYSALRRFTPAEAELWQPMLRMACVRFWLSRLIAAQNVVGQQVQVKDPDEFYRLLRARQHFHSALPFAF